MIVMLVITDRMGKEIERHSMPSGDNTIASLYQSIKQKFGASNIFFFVEKREETVTNRVKFNPVLK